MTTPKCGSNLVSRPSFGRGFGPRLCLIEWSVLLPGLPTSCCSSRSRLAAIPGASATKSLHTLFTVRRGRQLSSIKSAPAASSTFAFLTKPSLPTTIHSTLPLAPTSSFSGTRTLELSLRLAFLFACLSLHNTSFNPLFRHLIQKLAATAASILFQIHSCPRLNLSQIRQPHTHIFIFLLTRLTRSIFLSLTQPVRINVFAASLRGVCTDRLGVKLSLATAA
jgi:hypothetical protein